VIKMKKLLYILFFVLITSYSWGATYYLSLGGNDSDGSSWANAYNHLADLNNAITWGDGDIVNIRPGDKFEDVTAITLDYAGQNLSGMTITIQGLEAGSGKTFVGDGYPVINDQLLVIESGLSLVLKDFKIDSQEFTNTLYINGVSQGKWRGKIYVSNVANVTIDNVDGDGSVDWVNAWSSAIYINNASGNVEVKNCDLLYWGGGSGLWAGSPTVTGTGADLDALTINVMSNGASTLSIHDNNITGSDSDCLKFEKLNPSSVLVYDNTLWNCGENSVDMKGSNNISFYRNTVGRDVSFVGAGGSSTGEGLNSGQSLIQVLSATSVLGGCDNVEIYHNLIGPTDLVGIRIVANDDFEPNNNIRIHHNYFLADDRASGPLTEHIFVKTYSENVKIYDNIFDGLQEGGTFYHSYYAVAPANPTVIYNNTFYSGTNETTAQDKIYGDQTAARVLLFGGANCGGGTWKNNIFYVNDITDKIFFTDASCTPTMSNNIFFNANAGDDTIIQYAGEDTYEENELAAWNAARGGGALFENPDMVAPATNDFTLDAASPAIDAAVDLGGVDYDLGWSPATSLPPVAVTTLNRDTYGWDIGAYVYLPAAAPPTISGVLVDANGTKVTITFSAEVTQGSGFDGTEFNLDISGGATDITMTYVSGDTGAAHIYTAGQTILASDVVNLDCDTDADALENGAGADLEDINDVSVSNSSAVGASSAGVTITGN